ncbi:MAG: hypothetical protein ACRDNF_11070 [Streptosporangiaceae bacterium]
MRRRLEELLIELGDPSGELLVGEFCKDSAGQELVGDQAGAFGLGEPALQGRDLPGEAVVLGSGVLQLGAQGRSAQSWSLRPRRSCRSRSMMGKSLASGTARTE